MTDAQKTYREHKILRMEAIAALDDPASSPSARCSALLYLAYNDEDPAFVSEKGVAALEFVDPEVRMAALQSLALVARFHGHVNLSTVEAVLGHAADPDERVRDAAEDALDDLALFGPKSRPYVRRDAVAAVAAGPDGARIQAYAAIANGEDDWPWARDFLLLEIMARAGVQRVRALSSLGWCALAHWRAEGVDLKALPTVVDDNYYAKIFARVRLQLTGIEEAPES